MTRIGLGILWLLHFLPRPVLWRLGEWLGVAMYHFGRGYVTKVNLRLCFPELSVAERNALAMRHLRAVGRSAIELPLLWYAPIERILACTRLADRENLDRHLGNPVILLTPHFLGLDFGAAAIGKNFPRCCTLYSRQKNPVVDQILRASRRRWGDPVLVSRQEGLRPVIRLIKQGLPFYYLPDMDFGARDSVFVPFFGHPAATVTALSRLARLTGAVVVPCITRITDDGSYETRLYPAWENFPGASLEEDARRMNAFIEDRARAMPEQYFWVHKRFKTRPPGSERNVYREPVE